VVPSRGFSRDGLLENSMSDLAIVFETTDMASFALAKVLLDADKIPFVAQGEWVQNLFGFGQYPGGYNFMMGPMRLRVDADNAERAREVLEDVER
jgi:hypothetical protein